MADTMKHMDSKNRRRDGGYRIKGRFLAGSVTRMILLVITCLLQLNGLNAFSSQVSPSKAMMMTSARSVQREKMVDYTRTASSLSTFCLSPNKLNAIRPHYRPFISRTKTSTIVCFAKRKKKDMQDNIFDWYDKVDDDASPDDVFWEEMERQRLISQVGDAGGEEFVGQISDQQMMSMYGSSSSSSPSAVSFSSSTMSSNPGRGGGGGGPPTPTMEEERSAEATLASYAAYMVDNNWLSEDYPDDGSMEEYQPWDLDEEVDIDEENRRLDEQIDQLMKEGWADTMSGDEPWDHWGEPEDDDEEIMKVEPGKASEYLLKDEDDEKEEEDAAKEEEAYLESLSHITIKSPRLENARNNPKAAAYFARDPDELQGYDRMWVCAIDNVCVKNLAGSFRNYGIQFADNFGDWEDGSRDDGFRSIEDIASFKARQVYEVTGLPCIASRTSFEVEPVRTTTGGGGGSRSSSSVSSRIAGSNPRVVSGYRFNDIGDHVDYIVEALKPMSEPTRVTRFRSCLCFYDGEMEVFDYGECDVDFFFANSIRTFIPMSSAINELCKTLTLTFGLEYQKWLKSKVQEALGGSGGASVKLRDRVLKEAKVLPNDIIDVSAFMDSKVDVNLMDDCGRELANRFMAMKPTKILTVATTGLVIAIPMAKYLQVPVVYARKERNIVMADTFQASYSSKTVGKNRELLVSKSHLDEDDRILIVDDFLSSGSSQEALLRIISDSGATAVGIAVLLEKVYDSGRQSLSGFNVPVESMVRVASVRDGMIQLLEEDGYDRL